MRKFVITILILMIVSVFSVKVVFADYDTVGEVNSTTVNVREEASTSSRILIQLGQETEVSVYGEENGWYQIEYNNIVGYVAVDYIDITEWGDTYTQSSSSNTSLNEETNTNNSNAVNSTSNVSESNTANVVSNETLVENVVENTITADPNETSTGSEDGEQTISDGEENTDDSTETVDTTATEFILTKNADVRINPIFTSTKSGTIAEGTTVTVVDEINKWVKITDGNVTGWAVRGNI